MLQSLAGSRSLLVGVADTHSPPPPAPLLWPAQPQNPAICCHSSDTLGAVIDKLAATRIHRVYLVDKTDKPIGVVSLGDIISVFVEEPADFKKTHGISSSTGK